ncbi:MAG: hypothetical protein H7325_06980 [Pedobacter sp.]|nr:hypothetical protein [Pedobacter sp.]
MNFRLAIPMYKSRIIELLARKMAGESTPTELNELMVSYADSISYDEILGQLWLNSDIFFENQPDVDKVYQRHHLKFKNELVHFEKEFTTKNIRKYKIQLGIVFTSSIIVCGKDLRKKINFRDRTIVRHNTESKLPNNANIAKTRQTHRIPYLGSFF